jgi:cell division septum initiation protein DivIVA
MDVLHDDPAVRVDEHALLHAAIQDVAGRVHEWHQQTEEAHRTLEDALVKVEEFRRRALSARDTIASVQEYERRLIQALESVQQAHEALAQAAHQRAEDTIAAAERAAREIVEEARRQASEHLESARREAEGQLSQARVEAERVVAEARQRALDLQQEAELRLASIVTRVEAFVSREEDLARSLEAVVRSHAESLEAATRLRSDVQEEILPSLRRMLRELRESETTGSGGLGPEARAVQPGPEPAGSVEPLRLFDGEIVVSPVESFTQATRFATTLSQMRGVRSVRLRSYAAAKATIDLVLEGQTLLALDIKFIDGHPVEVLERSDTRLVLQLTDTPPRPLRG